MGNLEFSNGWMPWKRSETRRTPRLTYFFLNSGVYNGKLPYSKKTYLKLNLPSTECSCLLIKPMTGGITKGMWVSVRGSKSSVLIGSFK